MVFKADTFSAVVGAPTSNKGFGGSGSLAVTPPECLLGEAGWRSDH